MPSCGVCVCVCVCLSRSWIMSKRINISSTFFTTRLPHHSSFSIPNGVAIYRRGLTGASNAGGIGKNAILDEYMTSLHTGLQCCQPYESRSVKNKAATNSGKRRALTAASVVRCSHTRTTKCLWRARRYTPETKGGQPPLGHNPRFLLP